MIWTGFSTHSAASKDNQQASLLRQVVLLDWSNWVLIPTFLCVSFSIEDLFSHPTFYTASSSTKPLYQLINLHRSSFLLLKSAIFLVEIPSQTTRGTTSGHPPRHNSTVASICTSCPTSSVLVLCNSPKQPGVVLGGLQQERGAHIIFIYITMGSHYIYLLICKYIYMCVCVCVVHVYRAKTYVYIYKSLYI